MGMHFEDREDAGRRLAAALPQFRGQPRTAVLGLARGGVPVAAAVASALGLPFGALLVRKLGIPGHSETAYGAIAWSGEQVVRVLNKPLLARVLAHGVGQHELDQVEHRERSELQRRAESYPGIGFELRDMTIILVDDGLATGATMRAAIEAVRAAGATTVAVAVPVASLDAQTSIARVSDFVLSLYLPGKFRAVGSAYRKFPQLEDHAVVELLNSRGASERHPSDRS
jgi:putative phosphoribosyl transferase